MSKSNILWHLDLLRKMDGVSIYIPETDGTLPDYEEGTYLLLNTKKLPHWKAHHQYQTKLTETELSRVVFKEQKEKHMEGDIIYHIVGTDLYLLKAGSDNHVLIGGIHFRYNLFKDKTSGELKVGDIYNTSGYSHIVWKDWYDDKQGWKIKIHSYFNQTGNSIISIKENNNPKEWIIAYCKNIGKFKVLTKDRDSELEIIYIPKVDSCIIQYKGHHLRHSLTAIKVDDVYNNVITITKENKDHNLQEAIVKHLQDNMLKLIKKV